MHIDNLKGVLGVVGAYSEGDFEPVLRQLPGKQAFVNDSIDLLRRNLRSITDEIGRLLIAATMGTLSARANVGSFYGEWREIMEGLNQMLEAVVGPLQAAAHAVEQIGRGEIPERISTSWEGDFGTLRDNLNRCIDAVNALARDTSGLAEAAVAGDLSRRGDVRNHQGEFARILEGVNRTLDTLMEPFSEAARVLENLAQRELAARMRGEYQGDHVRLKQSVNSMADALQQSLTQVASAVEQVSGAAAQIASSSQAVASGASEQAASFQETRSSLENVAEMSERASASAQQASELATSARAAATDGAVAVDRLQGTMQKIRQSAEGTSQIIRDVSDIAFQTNLLALNAAVEAARAGEAGRGFAVVAEEVRSLALRAKEAAIKTEDLIRQSVAQAAEGQAAAGHVADGLGHIAGSVSKVTDIVLEIAATAREQARGVEHVNRSVTEMDQVTQQNAASAEQSSAAAGELSSQAEELAALVGSFRLEQRALRSAQPAGDGIVGSSAPKRRALHPPTRVS
jgi:methyl-accepting chemotaxis protein